MTISFLLLGPAPREAHVLASTVTSYTTFIDLLRALFKLGNIESDQDDMWIVTLQPRRVAATVALSRLSASRPTSLWLRLLLLLPLSLDSLDVDQKILVVKSMFPQLNLVVTGSTSSIPLDITEAEPPSRISRLLAWIGAEPCDPDFDFDTDHEPNNGRSMIKNVFAGSSQSKAPASDLSHLMQMVIQDVCVVDLIDNDPRRMSHLCYMVGRWGFPAHEISNDGLAYCAFLMLSYAAGQVRLLGTPEAVPSDRDLLALVLLLRNAYIPTNPFHNFRHAVDVVHACFHFLVRLGCLPKFQQWVEVSDDEKLWQSDTPLFQSDESFDGPLTLVPLLLSSTETPPLNPIQTLAILVAALGHDMGHPGLSNAFMVKHNVPTARLYNNHLVLELFHLLVFVNQILRVCWPSFLCASVDDGENTVREIIIQGILATDMAEHFEYILRLKAARSSAHTDGATPPSVQLVAALLLKCADISNVSRPLRILSQWALVLAREFDMMAQVESRLGPGVESNVDLQVKGPPIPQTLQEILELNGDLHHGQLFFIDTFARGLFGSIGELLPALLFASTNIERNRRFWQARLDSIP